MGCGGMLTCELADDSFGILELLKHFRWKGKQLDMGAAQGQSLFLQTGKPVCLLQTGSRSILNPSPLRVNPEICQQQHLATVIWHIRRGTCLFIAIVPSKKDSPPGEPCGEIFLRKLNGRALYGSSRTQIFL
jgi:hypothetical protein